MNRRWIVGLLLFSCALVAISDVDLPLSRETLSTLLRAGETVLDRRVTLDVQYAGTQVDQEGQTHALYLSREENTLFLCFLTGGGVTPNAGETQTVTGRVVRVELQEQDLRDHRIYAIWLE